MVPRRGILVGLDLGTTAVKAAAWSPDGARLAMARQPAPSLFAWRGLEVQDPEALARAAEEVVARVVTEAARSLPGPGLPEVEALAFTTQRDTLLLAGPDGRPATPLLSWRVRHHLEDREARSRLLDMEAAGGREPRFLSRSLARSLDRSVARSLEAWLLERWARGFPLPADPSGGAPPPAAVHAGGDKNCEYLALGAHPDDPGTAVLSLGSAVALGVAVRTTPRAPGIADPPLPPGVVASPLAGGARGRNLETGILSGMGGRALAAELAGVEPWEGALPFPEAGVAPSYPSTDAGALTGFGGNAAPEPYLLGRSAASSPPSSLLEGPVVIPHFGGALDDATARARLVADAALLTPAEVARAWARGVVLELARLRPRLEAASGVPLRRVVVGGGGGMDPAWLPLLRAALRLPVEAAADPWAGCRGALLATGRLSAPETSAPGSG